MRERHWRVEDWPWWMQLLLWLTMSGAAVLGVWQLLKAHPAAWALLARQRWLLGLLLVFVLAYSWGYPQRLRLLERLTMLWRRRR